jgi:homoserine O-acetyltransferase
VLALGDVPLDGGDTLLDARLAYRTWGRLNAARDNCVVFPTYYTGSHDSNARMIGPGRALDPARWFIVVPNLFGNGISTSPSNAAPAQRGPDFPRVGIVDNVRCQHRLLREHLGVERVALATGWSMGAVQSYQWAVDYPDYVASLLPFCGAARCSPHNRVFIEGVRAALRADPVFADGHYTTKPVAGLKAFGRVYAGWAYSQAFFREGLYRTLGLASIDEFLAAWEDEHLVWDANDLMAKFWTWEHADVSAGSRFGGDLSAALGSIRARTIVMPGDQDLYFTLQDNREEAALIPGAELRPLHSAYGHCAGAPGRFPAEMAVVEQAMRDLLGEASDG